MKKFLLSTWLWGIILSLATLFFYLTSSGLETLELKFYDFRQQLNADNSWKKEIAVINIDDESITKIGRWPWSREKIADICLWLSTPTAKPSVIGINILFPEKEENDAIAVAEKLGQEYAALKSSGAIVEKKEKNAFLAIVSEMKENLDSDRKLAEAIKSAGNIILPMYFKTGNPMAKPPGEPGWIKKFSVKPGSALSAMIEGTGITYPLKIFTSSAAGIGHVNVFSETDGVVRREYPFISYNQSLYSSFAFEIVRAYLRRYSDEVVINPNYSAQIGKFSMPLNEFYSMMVAFNGRESFKTYSFYDVINGKVVPDAFRGKIVLIGMTAQGLGSLYVTPFISNMSAVNFTANIVENILNQHFIVRPAWAFQLELGLIVFTALFILLALPRFKATSGAVASGVLLAAFIGTGIYLFVSGGYWIKSVYPSFLLAAGYLVITSLKFLTTEKRKELVEMSAIETNKMLGLSFQGQGMLDLAFEKFRLCPLDEALINLLYNLGLDFERKRQFNKAVAVYEHIATKNPGYKDIKKKIDILKKASDGAVFAGGIGQNKESTILVEGSSTTPTLGRYEVLKELGKGAMGVVYLGRDPKINRTVAIKTIRFEEGIDEKELAALKDRFFREAQAAGNLSHPNIVKIYDAGDEQDIAYMAMELLKGNDLKKHARKDNILPLEKTLEYILKAADALDYAHQNGVIHRDIKPANLMLLEDGTIRVADFGIARIQESSKTATGTVLGTPYYMSPEQIAGKKVDGRADIFSLGVTFFELLTGEKPWKGGDAIATLFFQITGEPYPDPLSIKPDLPKEILPIIDKALKKNPDERYQRAGEMAEDIKKVLLSPKKPGAKPNGDSGEQKPRNAAQDKTISENKPAERPKPEIRPLQQKPEGKKTSPDKPEKPKSQFPPETSQARPVSSLPLVPPEKKAGALQDTENVFKLQPLTNPKGENKEDNPQKSAEKTGGGIQPTHQKPENKGKPAANSGDGENPPALTPSHFADSKLKENKDAENRLAEENKKTPLFGENPNGQLPLNETLGQPSDGRKPGNSGHATMPEKQKKQKSGDLDFEKTLPLIYSEEDEQ